MRGFLKNRKGFTLGELTIVMLLVAIVTTMVVSLSLSMNVNITYSIAKKEQLECINLAEQAIFDWVSDFDTGGRCFEVVPKNDENGEPMKLVSKNTTNESDTQALYFKEGVLYTQRASGTGEYVLESLSSLEVSVTTDNVAQGGDGGQLIVFKMVYNSGEEYEYERVYVLSTRIVEDN